MSGVDPRATLGRWLNEIKPDRTTAKQDLVAGLPGAISSVPDGMAASVLAGVNPVYGLYASGFGPIFGGLTSNTRLMVITTTSAAALAAGSTLSGVADADRADALFLLTVLAGIAMVVAGVFRLGRYTRFVSHSVMIGFLTGVGVNIIFGQIPDLLGVSASGSTNIGKAIDALSMIGDADLATFLIGMSALAIVVVLDRTKFSLISAVVALVVPTIVMIVAGLDSVARVEDVGEIPTGLPLPAFPEFGLLSFDLVFGALAVAAIVLVQGAGVAQSAPNTGGGVRDANQDFISQGVANLAAGAFSGQPVGGSVGQTASSLGATFVSVIDEYADRLHRAGGRLYLGGVDPDMMTMLERTNQINGSSHVRAFPATATVGEATAAAADAATTWLITRQGR